MADTKKIIIDGTENAPLVWIEYREGAGFYFMVRTATGKTWHQLSKGTLKKIVYQRVGNDHVVWCLTQAGKIEAQVFDKDYKLDKNRSKAYTASVDGKSLEFVSGKIVDIPSNLYQDIHVAGNTVEFIDSNNRRYNFDYSNQNLSEVNVQIPATVATDLGGANDSQSLLPTIPDEAVTEQEADLDVMAQQFNPPKSLANSPAPYHKKRRVNGEEVIFYYDSQSHNFTMQRHGNHAPWVIQLDGRPKRIICATVDGRSTVHVLTNTGRLSVFVFNRDFTYDRELSDAQTLSYSQETFTNIRTRTIRGFGYPKPVTHIRLIGEKNGLQSVTRIFMDPDEPELTPINTPEDLEVAHEPEIELAVDTSLAQVNPPELLPTETRNVLPRQSPHIALHYRWELRKGIITVSASNDIGEKDERISSDITKLVNFNGVKFSALYRTKNKNVYALSRSGHVYEFKVKNDIISFNRSNNRVFTKRILKIGPDSRRILPFGLRQNKDTRTFEIFNRGTKRTRQSFDIEGLFNDESWEANAGIVTLADGAMFAERFGNLYTRKPDGDGWTLDAKGVRSLGYCCDGANGEPGGFVALKGGKTVLHVSGDGVRETFSFPDVQGELVSAGYHDGTCYALDATGQIHTCIRLPFADMAGAPIFERRTLTTKGTHLTQLVVTSKGIWGLAGGGVLRRLDLPTDDGSTIMSSEVVGSGDYSHISLRKDGASLRLLGKNPDGTSGEWRVDVATKSIKSAEPVAHTLDIGALAPDEEVTDGARRFGLKEGALYRWDIDAKTWVSTGVENLTKLKLGADGWVYAVKDGDTIIALDSEGRQKTIDRQAGAQGEPVVKAIKFPWRIPDYAVRPDGAVYYIDENGKIRCAAPSANWTGITTEPHQPYASGRWIESDGDFISANSSIEDVYGEHWVIDRQGFLHHGVKQDGEYKFTLQADFHKVIELSATKDGHVVAKVENRDGSTRLMVFADRWREFEVPPPKGMANTANLISIVTDGKGADWALDTHGKLYRRAAAGDWQHDAMAPEDLSELRLSSIGTVIAIKANGEAFERSPDSNSWVQSVDRVGDVVSLGSIHSSLWNNNREFSIPINAMLLSGGKWRPFSEGLSEIGKWLETYTSKGASSASDVYKELIKERDDSWKYLKTKRSVDLDDGTKSDLINKTQKIRKDLMVSLKTTVDLITPHMKNYWSYEEVWMGSSAIHIVEQQFLNIFSNNTSGDDEINVAIRSLLDQLSSHTTLSLDGKYSSFIARVIYSLVKINEIRDQIQAGDLAEADKLVKEWENSPIISLCGLPKLDQVKEVLQSSAYLHNAMQLPKHPVIRALTAGGKFSLKNWKTTLPNMKQGRTVTLRGGWGWGVKAKWHSSYGGNTYAGYTAAPLGYEKNYQNCIQFKKLKSGTEVTYGLQKKRTTRVLHFTLWAGKPFRTGSDTDDRYGFAEAQIDGGVTFGRKWYNGQSFILPDNPKLLQFFNEFFSGTLDDMRVWMQKAENVEFIQNYHRECEAFLTLAGWLYGQGIHTNDPDFDYTSRAKLHGFGIAELEIAKLSFFKRALTEAHTFRSDGVVSKEKRYDRRNLEVSGTLTLMQRNRLRNELVAPGSLESLDFADGGYIGSAPTAEYDWFKRQYGIYSKAFGKTARPAAEGLLDPSDAKISAAPTLTIERAEQYTANISRADHEYVVKCFLEEQGFNVSCGPNGIEDVTLKMVTARSEELLKSRLIQNQLDKEQDPQKRDALEALLKPLASFTTPKNQSRILDLLSNVENDAEVYVVNKTESIERRFDELVALASSGRTTDWVHFRGRIHTELSSIYFAKDGTIIRFADLLIKDADRTDGKTRVGLLEKIRQCELDKLEDVGRRIAELKELTEFKRPEDRFNFRRKVGECQSIFGTSKNKKSYDGLYKLCSRYLYFQKAPRSWRPVGRWPWQKWRTRDAATVKGRMTQEAIAKIKDPAKIGELGQIIQDAENFEMVSIEAHRGASYTTAAKAEFLASRKAEASLEVQNLEGGIYWDGGHYEVAGSYYEDRPQGHTPQVVHPQSHVAPVRPTSPTKMKKRESPEQLSPIKVVDLHRESPALVPGKKVNPPPKVKKDDELFERIRQFGNKTTVNSNLAEINQDHVSQVPAIGKPRLQTQESEHPGAQLPKSSSFDLASLHSGSSGSVDKI